MGPELGLDLGPALRGDAAHPATVPGGQPAAPELRDGSDHHPVGGGVELQDIEGDGVGAVRPDPQPAPLPDGVEGQAPVLAEHPSGAIHDRPRLEPAGQPPAQVAGEIVPDEAELLGVRLGGGDQPERGGLGAHLGLARHVAERQERGPELGLVEAVEGVGLVLADLAGAVKGPALRAPSDPRVVAGGDMGRADGPGTREQHAELDPLVAAHAGVGRPAGRVVGLEAGDDLGGELALEIPDQVADPEPVGDPAGVLDRVDGTASPVADLLPVARPHGQGHPEGLDTPGHAAGSGHAAVDPTGHRHRHHGAVRGAGRRGRQARPRRAASQGGDGHPCKPTRVRAGVSAPADAIEARARSENTATADRSGISPKGSPARLTRPLGRARSGDVPRGAPPRLSRRRQPGRWRCRRPSRPGCPARRRNGCRRR